MSIPHTREEWAAAGRKLGLILLRFQFAGLVFGVMLTVFAQLLTGYWDFRSAHQQMLNTQWTAVIDAQDEFESKLALIDNVLSGQSSKAVGSEYAIAAQTYIRSMEAISRSLPQTAVKIADYIDSIAALRKYYDVVDVPPSNSSEWVVFYGEFRQDFDRYVQAREEYFSVLASELGDYQRYLTNS